MSITKRFYGKTTDGTSVDIFTLENSKGMKTEITNYGGRIVSLFVPDKKGDFADVVLGYDSLDGYLKNNPFFGALIGRHANRIEFAAFEVNGVEYKVAENDGKNHLHGGIIGFDKVVWQAEIVNENLVLSYLSKDGEEGYPGNLQVKVTYALTEDNELSIKYHAVTDKDTVVNLTNHSYFNLAGHASGDILNHQVMINADQITEADKYSIPTGKFRDVEGTPMDLRKLTTVAEGINSDYDQIVYGCGYDHNWVLKTNGKDIEKIAEVFEPASGRVMEVYTNKPGVQFYSGNFISSEELGKGGVSYGKRTGLCLETQFYPNSVTHKHFPSPILRVGQEYNFTTIYKFSAR